MGRYSENTLTSWTKPASTTEEDKISNAISMIKSAIKHDENFNNLKYEVFVQGSYGNNTNVRTNSDIDVNIMLTSTFYSKYPDGKNNDDYGFIDGSMSYKEYKELIVAAIINKFGNNKVTVGNKSIKIEANSYRVEADCIPSFQYRNYKYNSSFSSDKFVEGVKYIALDSTTVVNYPRVHIENGIKKNSQTGKNYKKLVRLIKRVEADCIPSFQYRNYKYNSSFSSDKFVEGVKYIALDSTTVVNYPRVHIENGIKKNSQTGKNYKKLVRLIKRLRNTMISENHYNNENITSFLVECLIWNIPNNYINNYDTWDETIKQSLIFINSSIKDGSYSKWGEVSEMLYLFHNGRKWTVDDVQKFINSLWIFMGY